MRRTVIALLLFVSSAATAVAQPAKQNRLVQAPQKHHCDVGVISHLGETFTVGNKDVPVEWHIDDLVVDRIRATLGRRAAVQRIPYRKEEIARFETPTRLFGDQPGERLRTLAAGWRCARYVVVTRGREYQGEADVLVGLGIRIRSSIFFRYAIVYALIMMEVYDGETFSRLRWTASVSHALDRKVDESLWPDSPENVAQNAKLRDVTREKVARELDPMLPKLRLTP